VKTTLFCIGRPRGSAILVLAATMMLGCTGLADSDNPGHSGKPAPAATTGEKNAAADPPSASGSSDSAAANNSQANNGETDDARQPKDPATMGVSVTDYGKTSDGRQVQLFRLTNRSGMVAEVTNFGATLVSLAVPDRDGNRANVVLGYDSLAGYQQGSSYFGCTVGRYANRISGGRLVVEGPSYQLAINNEPHHLHGGQVGFNKRLWQAKAADDGSASVSFTYVSPAGEENYPGELTATVTYTLTDKNELRLDYRAVTDETTVCNLTHHSYFNLAGHDSGDVLDHELMLACEKYLPVDETLIPTGELAGVGGTPLDFRTAKAIGAEIDKQEGLYDHCFVIGEDTGEMRLAARATDPASGRTMEVHTTEPGIQFYTANHLDGSEVGPGNTPYRRHQGFCLETQHFPDSPNQEAFPSTLLKPGQEYRSTTIHRFSW